MIDCDEALHRVRVYGWSSWLHTQSRDVAVLSDYGNPMGQVHVISIMIRLWEIPETLQGPVIDIVNSSKLRGEKTLNCSSVQVPLTC